MGQRVTGIYRLVTLPALHRALMFALGSERAFCRYAEILDVRPGMKVLDVGCGTANIFPYLPAVEYTGIDQNETHIAFARERYGDKARFIVGDARDDLRQEAGTFDLINISALLHHLSDDEAAALFRSVKPLLKAGGRIVTIDPVFLQRQRFIAKFWNRMDSGLNIRTPQQYVGLLDGLGFDVRTSTLNDLLRIPYDHFVMTITR